ncbi:NACHT domain-containing protein [Streptomyces sparsus]
MEPAAFGVRLGAAVVVPLVRKLFVQDGSGAGLVDRPIRVSRLVSFTGEKRSLTEADMLKIATELVQRAVHASGPAEPPVPTEEQQLVAESLATSLHALGTLDMDDVQAVHLGPERLARTLRERADSTMQLSADGLHLHDALLHVACVHVLHFFTQRSTFVARTLVSQSRQLGDLEAKTDLLIERSAAVPAEDARFESRYAGHIEQKHSLLTIYGVDLSDDQEWPLDTAYLSLETVVGEESAQTSAALSRQTPITQPADRALTGNDRVLLRGVAGSGKTTLVQWLAVTTARQDADRTPAPLVGRVPFVLPLRTLTRHGERLPAPEGFLAAVGCPLAGTAPTGWADRVLSAGRGLLLVDGIDEVPAQEREHARRWLRELLAAFPGNPCLVTARPAAVRENWLASAGFTELTLARMSPQNVSEFLHRWHRAADTDAELERSLRDAIRTKADLGRLATNPLMCALICALHRDRRGFLPRGRKALFDAALSMLLERRDRERDMGCPTGIDVDADSQAQLLQKLAYWLIRNGRSELDRSIACDLLARLLPSMPQVAEQGTPEQVYTHLLNRSGLLREPTPDTVQFVHRTFQDYLGAREAVEERDFDLLIGNAHLDQWEDVVRMAVAHARPDERAVLLNGLVERGDQEEPMRTRLHLVAMACLENATQLAPTVRERVQNRAEALIPPVSIVEGKALAAVGPVVLELLPGPAGLDEDEATAVVHTAAQIGGEAALPLLKQYRDHPSGSVKHQLAGHWDRFDTVAYADEIVTHVVGRPNVLIVVRSRQELATLGRLGGHGDVTLRGDFTAEEIRAALSPEHLVRLSLDRNERTIDLRLLAHFPLLEEVDLRGPWSAEAMSPLAEIRLRTLWLWDLEGLESAEWLSRCTELHELGLRGGTPWPGFSSLPACAPLKRLHLPNQVHDLPGIVEWPGIEYLNLFDLRTPLTNDDWSGLANLPKLHTLVVSARDLHGSSNRRLSLAPVTDLFVIFHEPVAGSASQALAEIVRRFPSLVHVQLSLVPADLDLAPLGELPNLQRVSVVQTEGRPRTDRLPSSVQLTIRPRRRRA